MDNNKQKSKYMNDKYNLKGINGKFFVKGQGFTACTKNTASVLSNGEIACAAGLGYNGTAVEAILSYAVVYIRKGEGVKLLNGGSKNTPDINKGQVDPSKRRFATEDEAWKHGTRARERRANQGDQKGTAGHEGFFVIETSDPVNSAVNWKSGLTNSL